LTVASNIISGIHQGPIKIAFITADGVLSTTRNAGQNAIKLAQQSIEKVRIAGDDIIRVANDHFNTVVSGVLKISLDTATATLNAANRTQKDGLKLLNESLEQTKQIHQVAIDSARRTVNTVMDGSDAISYNAAMAGLEIAKKGINVAKFLTDITIEQILVLNYDYFYIKRLYIYLNLAATSNGKFVFHAEVSGVLLKKPFELKVDVEITDFLAFAKNLLVEILMKLGLVDLANAIKG